MSNFTSYNLIDNLNKHYPTIVGEAIIGYIEIHRIQVTFLSSIPQQLRINDMSEIYPTLIPYLIAYANMIQYAKSYYLQQIVLNIVQMNNLTDYVNIIGPLLSSNVENKDRATIEELHGGGSSKSVYEFFINFMAIIIITSLTNVTGVSTAISPLGQVSTSINIEKRQIPQAFGFQEELDPLNESAIIEFTKQYNPNAIFREDRVASVNIKEEYESPFIEQKIKQMSSIELLVMKALYGNTFHQDFTNAVKDNVERVNTLTITVHKALEEMCVDYTKTTDPLLPIPLFKLFNSHMADKSNKMVEKRQNLLAEKETEIKSQKITEMQVTTPEPSLFSTISHDLTTSISSMFWSPSPKTRDIEHAVKVNPPTTEELISIYDELDNAVQTELTQLESQIDQQIFDETAIEIMTKLAGQSVETIQMANLQVYLATICKIKKPKYVFDETTGDLYIKDPSRSRTHLLVLAKNTITYYETVVKGVKYIKADGEMVEDIPDEKRLRNMKSLFEKAQAIVQVLSKYDVELVKSLAEGFEIASNPEQFFENISNMWLNIKSQIIDATAMFPISEQTSKRQMDMEKEQTTRLLKEELHRYNLEKLERLQSISLGQESNNLTASEWKLFLEYFSISTKGVFDIPTMVVNNAVNATADMANNGIENANRLLDTGMSSILSVVWGITIGCMGLFIPAVCFIALKTGFITSVFNDLKRRIDRQPEQPSPSVTSQPSMSPPPLLDAQEQPSSSSTRPIVEDLNPEPSLEGIDAHLQNTDLTVPDNQLFGELIDDDIQELSNTLQNLSLSSRGGGNTKTRKRRQYHTKKRTYIKRTKKHHKKARKRATKRNRKSNAKNYRNRRNTRK